jgi:TolA-binding protein
MMSGMRWSILALGAVLGLGAAPATAQMVTDPTIMRSCLCEQQAVTDLQDAVSSRRVALDSARSNASSLNNQVTTRRAQINVYNANEIEAFKQLLEQRDAAQAAAAGAAQSYDNVATSYNQAADAYNARCAGRSYDETVLRQVRATLSCPRLPPSPP